MIQSHVEETIVSLFHREEYVEVSSRVERVGDGLQSLVSSQHQDGAGESVDE